MNPLRKKYLLKFASKCPEGKRGRPMSTHNEAELAKKGIDICEKTTKDGRTVFYKTGQQLKKEKEGKEQKRTERKQAGIKAKGRISKAGQEKINKLRDELKGMTEGLKNLIKKKEAEPVEKPVEKVASPQIISKKEKAVEFDTLGWVPKSVIESQKPLKIADWFVKKFLEEPNNTPEEKIAWVEAFPKFKPAYEKVLEDKKLSDLHEILMDTDFGKMTEILGEKRVDDFLDNKKIFTEEEIEKLINAGLFQTKRDERIEESLDKQVKAGMLKRKMTPEETAIEKLKKIGLLKKDKKYGK